MLETWIRNLACLPKTQLEQQEEQVIGPFFFLPVLPTSMILQPIGAARTSGIQGQIGEEEEEGDLLFPPVLFANEKGDLHPHLPAFFKEDKIVYYSSSLPTHSHSFSRTIISSSTALVILHVLFCKVCIVEDTDDDERTCRMRKERKAFILSSLEGERWMERGGEGHYHPLSLRGGYTTVYMR